jgi:hypothetical protein
VTEVAPLPDATTLRNADAWQPSDGWTQALVRGEPEPVWTVDARASDQQYILELKQALNLATVVQPQMRFTERGQLGDGDTIAIEVLPERGGSWQPVYVQTGASSDWTLRNVDLSDYEAQTVRIRIRVTTGRGTPSRTGDIRVQIDDVTVGDARTVRGG